MIKTSGYRVSPHEIEASLLELQGVREAVAFGVPDERLGQAVVAVLHADPNLTQELVLTACRQQLPGYMVPRLVELRNECLPRNANGKIDRPALMRMYLCRHKNTSAQNDA